MNSHERFTKVLYSNSTLYDEDWNKLSIDELCLGVEECLPYIDPVAEPSSTENIDFELDANPSEALEGLAIVDSAGFKILLISVGSVGAGILLAVLLCLFAKCFECK